MRLAYPDSYVVLGEWRVSPSAGTFRDVMSRFPTGVVVVTTRVADDDFAMSASSFTSVSLDPLLVLICVQQDTWFHNAITSAGDWAVNVLPEDGGEHADWFAHNGRPMPKGTDQVHRSESSNLLYVTDAVAHLECRTQQIHQAGDHDIVIGEVLDAHVASEDMPLVYWKSRYHEGLTQTDPFPPQAATRAPE